MSRKTAAPPTGSLDSVRLHKESKDVGASQFAMSGVMAEPAGDLSMWKATIKGPADTPYEGGTWQLDIKLPATYPFDPPSIKFVNKIWHPNISSVTGAICLDILKSAWSPALSMKTALLSISALLSAPEPTDPQDAEVASQYTRNRAEWAATARFWTETYAMPKAASGLEEGVSQLTAMGFDAAKARDVLAAKGGNIEAAIEALMG